MTNYPYTIDNGRGERLTFTGLSLTATGVRANAVGVAQPGAGAPMHVHYAQEEAIHVMSGLLGYQVEGRGLTYIGPGQTVVWPAGTRHRWWNAGSTELHTTGWCQPPGNVEFYLATVFASMKTSGGSRPRLFDFAFLATRYRTEFAMLEMPALVRHVVMPLVYALGWALGRYEKFKDAPPAAPALTSGVRPGGVTAQA